MPTDLLIPPPNAMDPDSAARVTPPDSGQAQPSRQRLRPLVGIPGVTPATNWRSTAASVALHVVIVLLILIPTFGPTIIDKLEEGAGGAGPRGGGGGGRLGTGGIFAPNRPEQLRFVRPPSAPPPALVPVLAPPPEIKKPEEKKPEPQVQPPTPAPPAPAAVEAAATTPGSGGGSGADGSKGNGPGTGGGIGSGVGTGTGSGTGPGTGGGAAEKYPPTVTNLPILPLPVPGRVRPYYMVAYFAVDEKGNSRLIGFNPSSDGGYNKRIKEMLSEIRFRPAVLRNGMPVADTTTVRAEAP